MTDDYREHYGAGVEEDRVDRGTSSLEFERTKELLVRFLPPPPASVLDVGGGPGAYSAWLAQRGYRTHLIDPVPLHVEQAVARAAFRLVVRRRCPRLSRRPGLRADRRARPPRWPTPQPHREPRLVHDGVLPSTRGDPRRVHRSGSPAGRALRDRGFGASRADLLDEPAGRARLIRAARAIEEEPSLSGLSDHLLAIGRPG